jgi:hypothetical protein
VNVRPAVAAIRCIPRRASRRHRATDSAASIAHKEVDSAKKRE